MFSLVQKKMYWKDITNVQKNIMQNIIRITSDCPLVDPKSHERIGKYL